MAEKHTSVKDFSDRCIPSTSSFFIPWATRREELQIFAEVPDLLKEEINSKGADRLEQTEQTQIRLLQKEQSLRLSSPTDKVKKNPHIFCFMEKQP